MLYKILFCEYTTLHPWNFDSHSCSFQCGAIRNSNACVLVNLRLNVVGYTPRNRTVVQKDMHIVFISYCCCIKLSPTQWLTETNCSQNSRRLKPVPQGYIPRKALGQNPFPFLFCFQRLPIFFGSSPLLQPSKPACSLASASIPTSCLSNSDPLSTPKQGLRGTLGSPR